MLRFIKILVEARPAITYAVRMLRRFIPVALLTIVGCDVRDTARDRAHVNAMQREVTQTSKELTTADSKARAGWVEAQKSFEQSREAMVKQQSEIQRGLDRLESERKSIASWRILDLLTANSLESLGMIVGSLVPLMLLGWLMQHYWHSERVFLMDDLRRAQSTEYVDVPTNAPLVRQRESHKPDPLNEPRFADEPDPDTWLLDA